MQPALLDEARKRAAAEGVSLNRLINAALAEKLSALRTENHLEEAMLTEDGDIPDHGLPDPS